MASDNNNSGLKRKRLWFLEDWGEGNEMLPTAGVAAWQAGSLTGV